MLGGYLFASLSLCFMTTLIVFSTVYNNEKSDPKDPKIIAMQASAKKVLDSMHTFSSVNIVFHEPRKGEMQSPYTLSSMLHSSVMVISKADINQLYTLDDIEAIAAHEAAHIGHNDTERKFFRHFFVDKNLELLADENAAKAIGCDKLIHLFEKFPDEAVGGEHPHPSSLARIKNIKSTACT